MKKSTRPDYTNPISFFCGTKSSNTPTEPRADDHDIVIEVPHIIVLPDGTRWIEYRRCP